jgi:hypothetical protein
VSVFSEAPEDSWDPALLHESDFDRQATYFVPDKPCPEDTKNHAEESLPRNLTLRPSCTLKNVSSFKTIVTISQCHIITNLCCEI